MRAPTSRTDSPLAYFPRMQYQVRSISAPSECDHGCECGGLYGGQLFRRRTVALRGAPCRARTGTDVRHADDSHDERILLDEAHVTQLRGKVDLLAISLDGVPESHNRMRSHPRAFEIMVQRLDGLRKSDIVFGFIFTLSQYNLDELPWVAEFAVAQRAQLLQIHPLQETGRAKQ